MSGSRGRPEKIIEHIWEPADQDAREWARQQGMNVPASGVLAYKYKKQYVDYVGRTNSNFRQAADDWIRINRPKSYRSPPKTSGSSSSQAGPSAPGPSSRRQQSSFDDDTDDDDDYELAPSTPRGPAYPIGDEANNALDHLILNYSQESIIRAGYVKLENTLAGSAQLRLLWAGVDKYRDDMKMVVPSTHPKFKVASDYCEKNFPNPMYMFSTRYQQKIVKLLTTEGLKKYEEAEKSAAASAQAERDRLRRLKEAEELARRKREMDAQLSEADRNARANYEARIKSTLEFLNRVYDIAQEDQTNARWSTKNIEEFYKENTKPAFDDLTKTIWDEIQDDRAIGMDSRKYLEDLITKGTNERMNRILRLMMDYCIIPPIPRGKQYEDLDKMTQIKYNLAVGADHFVLDYIKYAEKLNYVHLGNIKQTMKNWTIWYEDQDDADDPKYKGFDISGYIIRTGNLPTTLNVESMQAVEQPISSGTTYRINFYYPNPWEASGTIKYFDVVLA